jgi:hypothetical protein
MTSTGGRGSDGFCDTTMNRIDSSVSYTADCSGVGRHGRTLPRCHARVPIPVRMGGVGEMKLGRVLIKVQMSAFGGVKQKSYA